jgi:molybdopterin/thiamine biosynthesis adenylyltransferase/nitroreductase
MRFDYGEAFSRNIGWVTETEQEILRTKRVAIAGLGGVGGSHLLTLTRLGIGAFKVADLDEFELANFNRQAGASLRSIDKPKVEVLAELALDINPDLDLVQFPAGVNSSNIDDFLEGVDIYVDALDFFAVEVRNIVFAACHEKGIPAITAAPIGMGTALLCFMPGKMSYEQYFQMAGQSEDEQALRLLMGLSPAMLQMPYLVDDSRADFKAKKAPSTPMACEMCAGFAGVYALKILLNRGEVIVAPRGIHFDAYRNKLSKTWRPWGNRNPIQRLGLMIARRRVMASSDTPQATDLPLHRPIERILDLARWAPSGDNEQPWRFEIVDESHAVVHAFDTREWCVYDLDGRSSQVAVGAMLQTITIAATAEGMHAEITRRADSPEETPLFDVRLSPQENLQPHRLLPFIRTRTTQRKPLSTTELTQAQKLALEQAIGDSYRVVWIEGRAGRWEMAKLLFRSAHIRLTTPEAYEVHRKNIEWGARFSEDRIPEHAVGVDYLTRKIMRWALHSWERVQMLNRFFAGTWLPRLQMDLLAGFRCAAHFVIIADTPLKTIDDYIDGGSAMQRFWLEATRQGLQFQPEMTALIFTRYVAMSLAFTGEESENELAGRLAVELDVVLGADQNATHRVYMGRVGIGPAPVSRSIRRPLQELLIEESP